MLMRHAIFCFLSLQLFFGFCAAELDQNAQQHALDNILDLESGQAGFVKGVNVITGDFTDVQVDLVVPGPQPLVLKRSYHSTKNINPSSKERVILPPMLQDAWSLHHGGFGYHGNAIVEGKLEEAHTTQYDVYYADSDDAPHGGHDSPGAMDRSAQKFVQNIKNPTGINIVESNGLHLHYSGFGDPHHFTVDPKLFLKGITNTASGEISGRTNLKNYRITAGSLVLGSRAWVHIKGNGEIRTYKLANQKVSFLKTVKHPSGISFKNDYTDWKSEDNCSIKKVTMLNEGKEPCGNLTFHYRLEADIPHMVINSSGNECAHYNFRKKKNYFLLEEVIRPKGATEKYTYSDIDKKNDEDYSFKITRKDIGQKCFLEINYNPASQHNPHAEKVCEIKEPVGTDRTAITTYQFSYYVDPVNQNGAVTAYNAYGLKTDFLYDANLRLNHIFRYNGNDQRRDSFYWGSGSDRACLVSKVVFSNNKALACRHLIYDSVGNVKHEKIYGNLTGYTEQASAVFGELAGFSSPNLEIAENGIPTNNDCQYYEKHFKHSLDYYNLTTEQKDLRTTQSYAYHPNSNRLKSHFIKDANQNIKQRKFIEYDKCHAVCHEIIDDGSNEDINNNADVTERYEKVITNSKPGHGIPVGLPIIIEEYVHDLKLQQKKLIKKIRNFYDSKGLLLDQEHYDDQSLNARYVLSWKYDAKHNCIEEKNALDQVTTRIFDEYGNKRFEQGPCLDFYYLYEYDCMNRLINETLQYTNQSLLRTQNTLTTHHSYDYLNRCTSTTDWYGNTTHYIYDAFDNVIQTIHPPMPIEGGTINPVSCAHYNVLNQPIVKTDPNSNTTKYEYTLRGQPCHIEYPDGSEEYLLYTLDGLLDRKREKNGTTTQYEYDYQGRVVRKITTSPSGEVLTTTSAVYNHFHLLSETDPAGNTTYYDYEFGRLSSKTKGNEKETYHYDEFGRLRETRRYDGNGDFIAEIKEYDFLGQVVLEETKDSRDITTSKVAYAYDVQGNLSIIRKYIDAENFSQTYTAYDAFNQPIIVIDEEGNKTNFGYRSRSDGHFEKETIDAYGQHTYMVYDKCGRLHKEHRYNAFFMPIQQRDYYYAANGNPLRTYETIIVNHQAEKTIQTDYHYDCMNNLSFMIEAVGTPEERTTRHEYNRNGEKTKTIKPDGSEICYQYDALGRVIRYADSIRTFSYQYTYDQNSNVIAVWDDIHQCATTKSYDENDRLITEELANGLSMHYRYDGIGRTTQMTLPDNNNIHYDYVGEHLKQISKSHNNQTLYSHSYIKYNLAGKILQSQLIGNAGTLERDYDRLIRPKSISTTHWQENIPHDGYDKVNNLMWKTFTDEQGTVNCNYCYDELYQLSGEVGVQFHHYKYDSAYNRRNKNGRDTLVNHLNQLLHEDQNSYYYDTNGNLNKKTSTETVEYTYDGLDRLVKVKTGSEETSYQYDDLNRRLKKITNSQTVLYLYQGQNEIGACDENGNWMEQRTLGIGLGAEIGAAIAIELQDKVYAPIHDSNGNVTTLLSAETGDVFESYRYTAFGIESIPEDTVNPWRFSSKRKDDETGFIYFGRRYYDPEIGKFVTADPLGYDAGPNLYAYVLNNPMTHFDAYGLDTESALDENVQVDYNNQHDERDHTVRDSQNDRDSFWGGFLQGSLEGFSHPIDSSMELATSSYDEARKRGQGNYHIGESLGRTVGIAINVFTWLPAVRAGIMLGASAIRAGANIASRRMALATASAGERKVLSYSGLQTAETVAATEVKTAVSAEVTVIKESSSNIKNLPKDWIAKPSKKGGGIEYINPKNSYDRVRSMPGNPNSPNVAQQKPYVVRQINGRFYDKNGNVVSGKSPEAHIPSNEFFLKLGE